MFKKVTAIICGRMTVFIMLELCGVKTIHDYCLLEFLLFTFASINKDQSLLKQFLIPQLL
jgi:hypothetical protein